MKDGGSDGTETEVRKVFSDLKWLDVDDDDGQDSVMAL